MFEKIILFGQKYSMVFIVLFILLSGGFMALKEFWYFGTLRVFPSVYPVEIFMEGGKKFSCAQSSCDFSVTPGEKKFLVQKTGYKPKNFSVIIERGTVFEQNLVLDEKKVKVNALEGEKTEFFQAEKVFFPLSSSKISPSVKNFSFREKKLFWNDSFLFAPNENIFVSSDEIGRSVYILSENEIKQFFLFSQSFSTLLQEKISAFQAYSDEFFSFMTKTGDFFVFSEKKVKKFPKTEKIFSFFTTCMPRKDEIIFLYSQGRFVVLESYFFPKKTEKIIGLLENFSLRKDTRISCSIPGKVFISSGAKNVVVEY